MGKFEEATRLYEMLLSTGLRKSKFAKLLEMKQQSLNDYLRGTSDVKVISKKLSKQGFSIDWLYTGQGSMVFQTDRFEKKFEIFDSYNVEIQKKRILDWILLNYDSIENFQLERDIIGKNLFSVLENDDVLPHELLVKLENAGCNLKWTIDGRGSMYIKNINGKKLLRKAKK